MYLHSLSLLLCVVSDNVQCVSFLVHNNDDMFCALRHCYNAFHLYYHFEWSS